MIIEKDLCTKRKKIGTKESESSAIKIINHGGLKSMRKACL